MKVVEALEKISYFLSQAGERWPSLAYKKAAEAVSKVNLDDYRDEDLSDIPGIGKSIAKVIAEIRNTGTCSKIKELEKNKPPYSIREMEAVPGIGEKTAVSLWKEYGISNLKELEAFVRDKIEMSCFGQPVDGCDSCPNAVFCKNSDKWKKIFQGIEFAKASKQRLLHVYAIEIGLEYYEKIHKIPHASSIEKISFAGSVRRAEYSVKDIDILVSLKSKGGQKVRKEIADAFGVPENENKIPLIDITKYGPRKIDINFVPQSSWGTYINYFTGSKDFNIELRRLGLKRGVTINEHRVECIKELKFLGRRFRKGQTIPCPREEDLFEIVGVPFVPPECRVDGSELGQDFSNLVDPNFQGGDIHIHSTWSDGALKPMEIFKSAWKAGYSYIGISDHTNSVGVTGGLDSAKMIKYAKEIRSLRPGYVFVGAEVDVSTKGKIDCFDSLHVLDYVIIALHIQPSKDVTSRFIDAMKKIKQPKILAHPTGRNYGQRDEADADWEEIFKVARKTNTLIEINSSPSRVDLPYNLIRLAHTYGVKFVITSDFHGGHLNLASLTHYGYLNARKGLLTKSDVIQTLSQFKNWLGRGQSES